MDAMAQALVQRFVSVAQLFLVSCVSVLLAAAAYSLSCFGSAAQAQSHARILLTLLR